MQLEDGRGALRMVLPTQLQFFCLIVLRLQGTAAQEVHTVREAQHPALPVGFKEHHQGLTGVDWGRCVKREQKCRDTH